MEEIRKADGTLYARYVYDSWGNTVKILDANGNTVTDPDYLSVQNPIRYRGYYWDSESGLYYLQSRYYDPVTGRFVNPDTIGVLTASEMAVTDKNLYAYCDNNPVTRVDIDGEYWQLIAIGAAVGGTVSGVISAYYSYKDYGYVDVGIVLSNVASGAIMGALSMTSMKRASLTAVSAALAGTTYISEQVIKNEPVKLDELLVSVGTGALSGYIGGDGIDGKTLSNNWHVAKNTIKRKSSRGNKKYAFKEIARHSARKASVRNTVRVSLASSGATEVSLAFAKRKFGY